MMKGFNRLHNFTLKRCKILVSNCFLNVHRSQMRIVIISLVFLLFSLQNVRHILYLIGMDTLPDLLLFVISFRKMRLEDSYLDFKWLIHSWMKQLPEKMNNKIKKMRIKNKFVLNSNQLLLMIRCRDCVRSRNFRRFRIYNSYFWHIRTTLQGKY